MEDLHIASSLLSVALERYLAACLVIANSYDPLDTVGSVPKAILGSVANELPLLASHETKIKQAKSIISQARNSSPSIVPINSLPPEILARVFRLVLHMQSCYFDRPRKAVTYVGFAMHTCSRWRRIATSASELWTHVDLTPHGRSRQLLARASTFVARAASIPLHLHVVDCRSDDPSPDTDLNDFCASIAPRIQSLDISTPADLGEVHRSVLRSCCVNSVPGTLTHITLSGDTRRTYTTLLDDPENPAHISRVDHELRGITVLRLNGMYPHWTSQAYHGLVELRLTADGTSQAENTWIMPLSLLTILSSAPGLRIFHFGLQIPDWRPEDFASVPVPANLRDLEVLSLRTRNISYNTALIRLITPGPKPLHLSLKFPSPSGTHFLRGEVFTNFYARSKLVYLSLQGAGSELPLCELLRLLPDLQSLRLSEFSITRSSKTSLGLSEQEVSLRRPELDALHLRSCVVDGIEFRRMAEMHTFRSITIWECSVRSKSKRDKLYEMKKYQDELQLSTNFSVVKFLTPEAARAEDLEFKSYERSS